MSAAPSSGWLVLLAVIVCVVAEVEKYRVVVKQGALQGHGLTTRLGREFAAFQGIPYAKPPVGDLRFRSPQPAEPWSGVRDATRDSAICPQKDVFHAVDSLVEGSEDCLYLNVYSSKIESSNIDKSKGLDVMLWIHGGGWVQGAGSLYGPTYLLDKDIVLVTINYRLGPLGFLSTGDAAAPGNFGLKDQVAALRWVRDNIAVFGGNPDSVTIFGESSGGASVHFHMMSPMSEGLFHRAISQSGSALNPWAFHVKGNARSHAAKLATLFNCTTYSVDLVKCLREKDAIDLIKADVFFMEWDVEPFVPFRPVQEFEVAQGEEAFLTGTPEEILNDPSQVRQVPWLTGINSEDGAFYTARYYNKKNLVQEFNEDFNRLAPISMYYRETAPDVDEVSKQLRNFYFGDRPIDNNTRAELTNMYTDSSVTRGLHPAVKLQTAGSTAPVYLYQFTYRGSNSFSTLSGAPATEDYGVAHEDELQYLFPKENFFPGSKLTEEDEKMVEVMTRLWTNFARTGNPTPAEGGGPVVDLTWYPTSFKNLEFLRIGSESFMDRDLLRARAEFWASLPLKQEHHINRDDL